MNNDLLTYNALDCACTIEARNAFWSEINTHGYQPAYDMTLRLFNPLMFMMTRGIRVNFAALEETKVDITNKEKQAQEELNRIAGRELNALSPKECQLYFYVEKGIPPYYSKNGGVTTDDKALQRIARGTAKRAGLREAKLVQDIRGYRKLFGTYLDIDFDSDGRLRCAYNPRGTKFGRLSSSATVFRTGTNLQNLPAEFKKFLVPDPGYFFWEIDKRQAEWVVVAYLSGDANMLHVIETGEDPHTHTAHLMFRVPKEAIRIDHKLIGNLNDPDEIEHRRRNHPDLLAYIDVLPRMMSARQMGKKSNHGLNYDEGYRTFSLTNEIEEAEGKRIVTLYHSIYPGIRANYYESVKRQLTKDRTLTNCFGRKIRFLDAWGDSLFKAAYSAIPQSTVVDGLNIGMCEIYEDAGLTDRTGYNIDILAQVHDSILMQVPLSILDQGDTFWNIARSVYDKVSPEMEYNGRKFKIATDSKVGMNWGGYHPEVNSSGMQEVEVGNHPASFVSKVKRITNVEQGA